jgi:hypothetical protein
MLYNKLDDRIFSDYLSEYEKELHIAQTVSTTTGYFDMFSETSQFLMASENFVKQKEGVERIASYIID